jgi:hypothetical protein
MIGRHRSEMDKGTIVKSWYVIAVFTSTPTLRLAHLVCDIYALAWKVQNGCLAEMSALHNVCSIEWPSVSLLVCKWGKLNLCVHEANSMMFDIDMTHCIISTQTDRNKSPVLLRYCSNINFSRNYFFLTITSVNLVTILHKCCLYSSYFTWIDNCYNYMLICEPYCTFTHTFCLLTYAKNYHQTYRWTTFIHPVKGEI